MPFLFKVVLKEATVRKVECETPGYPNRDSDGDTIFENTHFRDEAEAWKRLEGEASAWVRLTAGELEECRNRETTLTRQLADRSLVLVQVQAARSEHLDLV